MKTLPAEQLASFLHEARESGVYEMYYIELTTGLRRGEICGLMWRDFDEKAGKLKIARSVSAPRAGVLEIGETKTSRGRRIIRLLPSTAQRLAERKKHAVSQWIFPEPLAPEKPVRPNAAYYWMKRILEEAGLPQIRFHDLRHPYVKPTTKNFLENKQYQRNPSFGYRLKRLSEYLPVFPHIVGIYHKGVRPFFYDWFRSCLCFCFNGCAGMTRSDCSAIAPKLLSWRECYVDVSTL